MYRTVIKFYKFTRTSVILCLPTHILNHFVNSAQNTTRWMANCVDLIPWFLTVHMVSMYTSARGGYFSIYNNISSTKVRRKVVQIILF